MSRKRRAPVRCEAAEVIGTEIRAAIQALSEQVARLDKAARRRDSRIRAVEKKQRAHDALFIAINTSLHSIDYKIDSVVAREAQGVKEFVGDILRVLGSQDAALAARITTLEEERETIHAHARLIAKA